MWIDLNELKGLLDKRSDFDDGRLIRFANAADAMIREAIGHVEAVTVTEQVSAPWLGFGYGRMVEVGLSERPVAAILSVTQVSQYGIPTPYVVDFDPTSTNRTVMLPVGADYEVVYRAGYDPIPANIMQAGLELAAHLYRASQLRTGGGRAKVAENEVLLPGMNHAMPMSVLQMLGINGSIPRNRTFVA